MAKALSVQTSFQRVTMLGQQRRLNGVDVAALILAENVERRNLSAGQRAMARAMLKPKGEKGGRGKTVADSQELSAGQVSRARFVFHHDEALARSVLSGAETLSAAYETAKASATARSVIHLFHLGGGEDFAGFDALRDQRLNVRLSLGYLGNGGWF
ncbi:hypothetical protein [Rhizobium croatiense]|uniref:hypothetical protein n=1 Tax=Rhizobium croatiense TaxID=2867516 RepID=UPI0023EB1570|nr:hypothetical protein [Rhizobium croatiense]WET75504.1 hypothetical protein PYR68_08485 [Rhizobium croatiense]